MGASGSELSIGGATALTSVGTRKSTSTPHRPLSTHNHQRLDLHAPPQTGTMNRHSSRRRTRTTGSFEATGGVN